MSSSSPIRDSTLLTRGMQWVVALAWVVFLLVLVFSLLIFLILNVDDEDQVGTGSTQP